MNNQTFVERLNIPAENMHHCLDAMEKYGNNHWWEPDVDPRKYAYYQIKEPTMLGNFRYFHESIELLLGRPVWTHEFSSIGYDALVQEAERAWIYQVGCTSEIERQERIAQSMESLEKWAKANGKQMIQVNLPESEAQA